MENYVIMVQAHSGIRFLVLLAGVLATLYGIYGVVSKPAWSSIANYLGLAFQWTYRLNFVIGLVLWIWRLATPLGFGWQYHILHFILIGAGLGILEASYARLRRETDDATRWALFLRGTLISLILLSVGVLVVTTLLPYIS